MKRRDLLHSFILAPAALIPAQIALAYDVLHPIEITGNSSADLCVKWKGKPIGYLIRVSFNNARTKLYEADFTSLAMPLTDREAPHGKDHEAIVKELRSYGIIVNHYQSPRDLPKLPWREDQVIVSVPDYSTWDRYQKQKAEAKVYSDWPTELTADQLDDMNRYERVKRRLRQMLDGWDV